MSELQKKKDDDYQMPENASTSQSQEIQKQEKEEEINSPSLGDESVKMRCPYCGIVMFTNIEFTNGYITYASLLFISLLFGASSSLILIPITYVLTKELIHKCSACETKLGGNGQIIYGIKSPDGILTLRFGELGFILTRKIVLGVILTILTTLLFYYRVSQFSSFSHSHEHSIIVPINNTWNEFLEECNIESIFRNHKLVHHCTAKYADKTVMNWDGYVIRVEDYRQSIYQYMYHAVSILVKMRPSENEDMADVLLTFDTDLADGYEQELNNIQRGYHISFNATFKSLGADLRTRHLHCHGIKVLDGYLEIAPHIHQQGRYSDQPRLIRKDKQVAGEARNELPSN